MLKFFKKHAKFEKAAVDTTKESIEACASTPREELSKHKTESVKVDPIFQERNKILKG